MLRSSLFQKSLLTIAGVCAPGSFANAGAWLAPAGAGEIITSVSFSGTTRVFDEHSRLIPVASYRKFELGTYIEYGAADWLNIVASPSVDRIQTAPSPGYTQTSTGLGDTAIGAKLKLYKTSDAVFSVQALVRPPLGLQTDSSNAYFSHSRIWTGEIRALAGYSTKIKGFDCFADLEAGYRWNDSATPDEWRADLTLGVHATPELLILTQNFAAISDRRSSLNPSYYWDKGQLSGVYAFTAAWSGQFGGFLTLAGRNAGREMGPMAALWYRF